MYSQGYQRLEEDASQYIFELPKLAPVRDLYNPVMVKITARDEAGNNASFTIPRTLICSKSEYFTKALMGDFVETDRREIELPDVSPWIFEVLVAWLYTGRIFYDPSEKTDGSKQRETTAAMTGEKRKHEEAFSETTSSASSQSADAVPRTQTMDHGDNINATDQQAEDDDDDQEDDYYDDSNPTTWGYRMLFELYIFADKYDTRSFRMQILNIIQLKHLQQVPCSYDPPSVQSTVFASEHLPLNSPLRRFLVDCWAREAVGSKDSQRHHFSKMPHDFLVECLVSSKAHASAHKPYRCCTHGPYSTQATQDGYCIHEVEPCEYHEHPEEGSLERDQRADMWQMLLDNFCS